MHINCHFPTAPDSTRQQARQQQSRAVTASDTIRQHSRVYVRRCAPAQVRARTPEIMCRMCRVLSERKAIH